jgi:small conductance mechanosensitive channel
MLGDLHVLIDDWLPLGLALVFVVLLNWGAHAWLIGRNRHLGSERLFARQLLMLVLLLASLVLLALTLPISESARGQIVALIGLGLSGLVAFSSTTLVANLMSGLMLRVTRPFATGDFISVQSHFGRVVQRGLLDTEIQTENRELVSLPNTVLISNPVTVIGGSGAIVTSTLSLGYDVHHARVEARLLRAAEAAGLAEPFVRVLELGNHAISYRVSGLLDDAHRLLTARSDLNKRVLDALHDDGIEVLSPTFMNHRSVAAEAEEAVVFDKAERAAQAEAQRQALDRDVDALQAQHAAATDDDERQRLKAALDEAIARRDAFADQGPDTLLDDASAADPVVPELPTAPELPALSTPAATPARPSQG